MVRGRLLEVDISLTHLIQLDCEIVGDTDRYVAAAPILTSCTR